MEKAEAIANIEGLYVGFRDLIAYLPDEAFSERVTGDWTLSQLLAHMAGWYREIAPAFGRVARGEPAYPDGNDYFDAVDTWNARFAEDAIPGHAALDDFDDAFHVYYAQALALDPEHYGIDPATGEVRPGTMLLAGGGAGHLDTHQRDVEAWLSRR